MNATIKYSKAIKVPRGVPAVPLPDRNARRDELKEMEAFIRSSGGKPMTLATKKRLVRAGCIGFPGD
jgi:hypothetical protein